MYQKEPQLEYDEIDLMDYIKVILKRKRLIFIVVLVVVAATGVFTWFSPGVYKISTALEIGKIGKWVVEEPLQVKEKINNNVYKDYSGIKAINPKNTNLIIIDIESKEPEKDKAVLEEINNLILTKHAAKINLEKSALEKDITRLQENIDFLLSKNQETATLYLEIINLEKQISTLQSTKIVKTPTISEKSVKPNPVLNIIIAAVLGLFIGIFLAFGVEWWKKNKGTV